MRICFILLLASIGVYQAGTGQDLSYTYPTTLPRYSKETQSVSLYMDVIENFEETMITPDYQIKTDPYQITYFKEGKIEKIVNLDNDRQVHYYYNKQGNIESRIDSSSLGFRTYSYKIDQAKNILEAYKDGNLSEVLVFDNRYNVISRKSYNIITKEVVLKMEKFQRNNPEYTPKNIHKDVVLLSETKSFYEDDRFVKRVRFKNDILQSEELYHYKEGKLHKVFNRNDVKPFEKKTTYTYLPDRTEIVTKSSMPSINATTPKSVEIFDCEGNKIKVYHIFNNDTGSNARVSEYRIN